MFLFKRKNKKNQEAKKEHKEDKREEKKQPRDDSETDLSSGFVLLGGEKTEDVKEESPKPMPEPPRTEPMPEPPRTEPMPEPPRTEPMNEEDTSGTKESNDESDVMMKEPLKGIVIEPMEEEAPLKVEPFLTLISPYSDTISMFKDGDSFPDLEFTIPGLDDPLQLHRLTLTASKMLASIFRAKTSMFGKYDPNAHAVEWTYERVSSDATYRDILVRWLRFCYGENQIFNPNECAAALVVLTQLELNCEEDMKEQIETYMVNMAKSDVRVGVQMLEDCVLTYCDFETDYMKRIRERIAECVLTRRNLEEDFKTVTDCLMKLPRNYLDLVEYGEEQSESSELNIRTRYVQFNQLDEQGKLSVMSKCDVEKLESSELMKMYSMGVLNSEKLIQVLETSLKKKEEECKMKDIELKRKEEELKQERMKSEQDQKSIEEERTRMKEKERLFKKEMDDILKRRISEEKRACEEEVKKEKKRADEAKKACDEIVKKEKVRAQKAKKACEEEVGKEQKRTKELQIRCDRMEEFIQRVIAICSSYSRNSVANGILGDCYFCGSGVKQNRRMAIAFWKRASEITGMIDIYQFTSNQDNQVLSERTPELDFSEAIVDIGICYRYGSGVMKDSSKAYELFQRASEMSNAKAICHVGHCYHDGEGVSKDLKKAVELYRRASSMGYAKATNSLGFCYDQGEGVPQDMDKAFELFKRAADMGQSTAINNLGALYLNGSGVVKNERKAIELFQRACDLGQPWGQNNLGSCYSEGDGVRQDKVRAFELWEQAADMGHSQAVRNLGVCYYNGEGVEKNQKKGLDLIKQAAKLGDSTAKEILQENFE